MTTIAAIATALSDAGISIIRISGPEAIQIADRIFKSKKQGKTLSAAKTHTMHYGTIVRSNSGEDIDEVLVSVMKGPNSYTAEDTVEINCHGGVHVTLKILDEVIKAGAVMAEPGEFTKRAFLNGRLDLSEAEAVMDVIRADSDLALKASVNQLKGSVSDKIKELRAKIIYEIAFIESALDDPEHISLDGFSERIGLTLDKLTEEIQKLIASAENGRIVKDGIHTVILGKPNAGKSSFLNMLLGEDRAIVTDIAGTTRDVLEENIRIGEIALRIIDTAGIRDTEDVVEKIGVDKAKKYAEEADLILYVADSSVNLDENDKDILRLIAGKKCIVLLNKSDLNGCVDEEDIKNAFAEAGSGECGIYGSLQQMHIIRTCTKTMDGYEEFKDAVSELFVKGAIKANEEIMITGTRHKKALEEALNSLNMVKQSLLDEMPEDFLSIDLMSAYASLGSIIGEDVSDDLVTEIFSKFCMGK